MVNTYYMVKKAGRMIKICTGCIAALRYAYEQGATVEVHRRGRETIVLDECAVNREFRQFAN